MGAQVFVSSADAHVHAHLLFFFFNDTATTEIYTLSLHDALPIYPGAAQRLGRARDQDADPGLGGADRKSTRLNSSHGYISYAVFCLKKKKKPQQQSAILESNVTYD